MHKLLLGQWMDNLIHLHCLASVILAFILDRVFQRRNKTASGGA
jgi:ABC-type proline/glycine betaine transport system permease subunit